MGDWGNFDWNNFNVANAGPSLLNNTTAISPESFKSWDALGNNQAFANQMGQGLNTGLPASASTGSSFMPELFGNGKGLNLALGGVNALSGLANVWNGMRQFDLQKDMFNFQKGAYNTDLANQSKLTNERLSTRQQTRNLDNPNTTPVADYMAKYGVSGKVGG